MSLFSTKTIAATLWLVAITAFSLSASDPANLVRNGDFENNSAPGEILDASNILFNFRMSQIRAIGQREGIDIKTFGMFATDGPQSGAWNITLTADESGESEKIAIPLKTNLDQNEPYQLEFFAKEMLSLTHSGGQIKVGVARDLESVVFSVFQSDDINSILWDNHSTTFVSPITAFYLIFEVDTDSNNFVALDNVSLKHARGELLYNGNFEDNELVESFEQQFDLPNEEFDAIMHNVRSIGASEGLDIINPGNFPIEGAEPFGNWKITSNVATAKSASEALSLALLSPLTAGENYYVQFYSERAITPGDLAGAGGYLSLGISTDENTTGHEIYQSPAVSDGWTRHGISFVAPNDGNFLTVAFEDNFESWVGVDNFSLRPFLLGDVNFDGEVNLLDVRPFVDVLTSPDFLAEADINQDGASDLLDVQPFVTLLTQ